MRRLGRGSELLGGIKRGYELHDESISGDVRVETALTEISANYAADVVRVENADVKVVSELGMLESHVHSANSSIGKESEELGDQIVLSVSHSIYQRGFEREIAGGSQVHFAGEDRHSVTNLPSESTSTGQIRDVLSEAGD